MQITAKTLLKYFQTSTAEAALVSGSYEAQVPVTIKTMKQKRISKNRDETRLINFRIRLSDLRRLDDHCSALGVTRTAGLEQFIDEHTAEELECEHNWLVLKDGTNICYECKTIQKQEERE